ncbi:major royal jelly protein-domain-containing protein [Phyllosticta citribraziliensis]|uniref:Major royal jelly protein-domain-containing protein n=1 Tax=Phyllosticta citribraziliensis TaxID=989973 RepID=A0ABR1L5U8_9PEZI
MFRLLATGLALAATTAATGYPEGSSCPVALSSLRTNDTTIGLCPTDFDVIGGELQPVHDCSKAPTGIAVDASANIFFTYARNSEPQNWTLTKAVNFTHEEPWPSEAWQNCATGQNASECFVNVQNLVLDDNGVFWVIDSGVPHGASYPLTYGPKILSFNSTTGELIRTYVFPADQFYAKLQLNDLRINNSIGTGGYAFITDDTKYGSISTIDLDSGKVVRHLYNTTFTTPDDQFLSFYNGEPLRNWNGTTWSPITSGSNGIALAGGNVYWSVKASHRWYFVSQEALVRNDVSDEELAELIQVPGNLPSETAGYTADDKGRLYITAAAQSAILYVDTQQSEVTQEINGVAAGGSGPVPTANYLLKTLVRSGLVQHADTACILDGWLYFNTNQQGLGPWSQYKNVDKRVGPFRSFRYWIGRGPAPA